MKVYRINVKISWNYYRLLEKIIKYGKTLPIFNKIDFKKICFMHKKSDDSINIQFNKKVKDKVYKCIFGSTTIEVFPDKLDYAFKIFIANLLKKYFNERIANNQFYMHDNKKYFVIKAHSIHKIFSEDDFKTVYEILNPENFNSLYRYFKQFI